MEWTSYVVNCDKSEALAHFIWIFILFTFIILKVLPKHDKFVAINIDFTGNDNK